MEKQVLVPVLPFTSQQTSGTFFSDLQNGHLKNGDNHTFQRKGRVHHWLEVTAALRGWTSLTLIITARDGKQKMKRQDH